MALLAGVLRLGFIFLFPGKVLFNITGEESEKNADHEGVVDDADPGKSLGDEVERIDQIEKTQKTAYEGAGGDLAVTTCEKVAEHGRGGADQSGKVGQLGAGAEGIHDSSLEGVSVSTIELSFTITSTFREATKMKFRSIGRPLLIKAAPLGPLRPPLPILSSASG